MLFAEQQWQLWLEECGILVEIWLIYNPHWAANNEQKSDLTFTEEDERKWLTKDICFCLGKFRFSVINGFMQCWLACSLGYFFLIWRSPQGPKVNEKQTELMFGHLEQEWRKNINVLGHHEHMVRCENVLHSRNTSLHAKPLFICIMFLALPTSAASNEYSCESCCKSNSPGQGLRFVTNKTFYYSFNKPFYLIRMKL